MPLLTSHLIPIPLAFIAYSYYLTGVYTMKYYAIIFLFLGFLSCKRDVPDYPETIEPNTLTLQIGDKFYKMPITNELLAYSGPSDLFIIAASAETEIKLQAKSYTHNLGAGNYFLTCCENEVLEKFTGGQYFVGIENGTVNNTPSEKGSLTITNINSLGYWGRFTFNGQNAVGEEKEFTGTFRVVY